MAPTIGPAAKHKLDHDDGRQREQSADRIDHASRPAFGGPFGPGTVVAVSVVVTMFSAIGSRRRLLRRRLRCWLAHLNAA
jgi:hypothetical protein